MRLKQTFWISAVMVLSVAGLCWAGWFDRSDRQIVIVTGTLSVKDDTERHLAESLANQTSAWLDELGLHHKRLADDEVTPWRLRGARAVILPYNPYPSPTELKAFESVVRSGGILLVFYGMDPGLASLMQVRIGPYRRAPDKQPWNGFSFDGSALAGLPESVQQSSDHLVPAFPDSGAAQIIARWNDRRGQPTSEPAWTRSSSGFWMSHVLQPGDDENIKQMMLAMLASVMPDAWQKAAETLLAPKRPFGEYSTLKEAAAALGRPLPRVSPASKTGGPESYRLAKADLADLTRHYAQHQAAGTSSAIRAIWLDDKAMAGPESWPALATSLASNRINTVFLHVGNPLALRTPGELFPPVMGNEKTAQPVILHAWLPCLNVEDATREQLAQLRTEKRLQISDTAEVLPWLCPSHPANRLLLAETATTLARSGVFAGVHLDYIRCKNSSACFCGGCRQRFEQSLGRPLSQWPADARSGAFAGRYRQWRAAQVTACVAAARDAVNAVNPAIKVSAAVYGATPSCFATVGQDWPAWLDRGLLDFACPMNYTSNLETFATTLKSQSLLPSAGRIIPGVGVSSSLSRLTADQAVAQAGMVQRAGFPGYVIFEFTSGVERDVLPYLKLMK